MSGLFSFRKWFDRLLGFSAAPARAGHRRGCYRLRLEELENRLVPAVTVQFGATASAVNEAAGTFGVAVTLSAASSTATSIPFTLSGTAQSGVDYSDLSVSPLVIPAGQTSGNITGSLLPVPAGVDKTIAFTLGTPTGGTLGSITTDTLTIEQPTTVSIADSSAVEPSSGGTVDMNFTLTRTGDVSSQITVGYTTVAGTAQANTDFTPTTGTATFAPGSATTGINIPIFGNGVYNQPALTFAVQLTGVVSAPITIEPLFPVTTTFPVGTQPYSVVLGDVNGDGKPDIVVANKSDGTVSVLLNTTPAGATTPSFAAQHAFAAGSGPFSVVLADINGDGKPDLVVSDHDANAVSVLRNTTPLGANTASFAAPVTFAAGVHPYSLAIADINGDGKPDIIVPNFDSNTVSVLLNTTATGAVTLSFAAQQTFPVVAGPTSVAVGDINGDGKPDIAVLGFTSGAVCVLLNTTTVGATTVSFGPRQDFAVASQPLDVTLGDVNGDGMPDLLVADNNENAVSVLLNTTPLEAGTPSFAAVQNFATGARPAKVALGDVDGDGVPDLVVADLGGNFVSVLANTTATGATTASFAPQQLDPTGSGPIDVALGDLNGDGKLDVVAADSNGNSVAVLLNSPITIVRASAVGTITESDPPPTVQFSAAAETALASTGVFTLTINLSALSGVATSVSFTLGGTAVGGTDYKSVTASPLVIPAGQTSGTITGTLLGGSTASKTLLVTLGSPTNATLGGTTSNTLTITPIFAPTGTLVTDSPTFSWAAVGGASSYDVWITDNTTKKSPVVPVLNTASTSWTLTAAQALTPGDNFTWYVGAVVGSSSPHWNGGLNFQIAALAPPTANATANPQTTDQPTFSWTGVSDAATYVVWITDLKTNKSQTVSGIVGTTLSWPSGMALTPGDNFTWWVGAVSTNGLATAWTAGQSFTVTPLVAPTANLLSTPQTTDQPAFSWASVPDAAGYDVWITDTTTNKSQTVSGIVGTSLNWPAANALTPGDKFTWWAAAVSTNGRVVTWNAGQNFTIAPLTAPTANLLANPQPTDQPIFSWTGVTLAATYEIWITDLKTNKSQTVSGIVGTSFNWPAAKALTPGDKFTWWIAAVSTNGQAAVWNGGQAFTIAPLAAPTGLGTSGAQDQPTFSWNAVADAGSYELWITDNSNGGSAVTYPNVPLASFTLSAAEALKPGHKYTWWVATVSTNGVVAAWSNGVNLTG